MFYIVKKNGSLKMFGECEEYVSLFEKLEKVANEALILTDSLAIYFEGGELPVLVVTSRDKAGTAKLKAKRLRSRNPRFSSLEEAFEFAERVEKMSLDEVARLAR